MGESTIIIKRHEKTVNVGKKRSNKPVDNTTSKTDKDDWTLESQFKTIFEQLRKRYGSK